MSEHITHVAVYEDCVRILKNSGNKITPAFHEALENAYDSGLLCCGSRGNHLYALPILEKNREIYGTPAYKQQHAEQVAGAIGWLLHRASDMQMKPIFNDVDKLENPALISDECQMYHDAVSFREVYHGGKMSTESPYERVDESVLSHKMEANPASKNLNIDYLENLMTHNYLAQIVDNCVFTKKFDDVDQYVDKLIDYSLDLYEDLRIYVRAYQNPEPFKQQAYITNFNIYNPDDELIQFVRYVQENGKPHPNIHLENALIEAETQSNYAQALKLGIDYTVSLSEFFDKKISEDEAKTRCRI
ncbi:MAG TPA: hypothetical protein VKA10_09100 [Prolixibacteraceae bacterium]|nr:hypothetical protein [Prolixibacteraceae bacterium]